MVEEVASVLFREGPIVLSRTVGSGMVVSMRKLSVLIVVVGIASATPAAAQEFLRRQARALGFGGEGFRKNQAKALGFGGKGFFKNQATALGFGGKGFFKNQATALGFGGKGFFKNQAAALRYPVNQVDSSQVRALRSSLRRRRRVGILRRIRNMFHRRGRRPGLPARRHAPRGSVADWRRTRDRFRPRPPQHSITVMGLFGTISLDGSRLSAAGWFDVLDKVKLERLCRYSLRSPFSLGYDGHDGLL